MQSAPRNPAGVCLRSVLPQAQVFGGDRVYADSCTTDADLVRLGDVYFALDACDTHGATHASRAASSGAQAIVTDQYLPIFTTPQYVVADAAAAHARFCHALLGNPSEDLTLSAVAGAHGKTTVGRLLTGILRSAGERTGCLLDGLKSDHATNDRRDATHPSTAKIARWMSECVVQGCEHAVLEVDSQSILDQRLAGAKLGVLCLTNLRFDRSTGRTPAADRAIVERLVTNLAPFATLVANADDPESAKAASLRTGLCLTYGFDKPADVQGELLRSHAGGQELFVTAGDQTVAIDLPYIGPALAQDTLAAIATAVALGVDLMQAARGAETIIRLPGVTQPVAGGQPFPILLDQANSPERLRAALNAARTATDARVLVVLPESPTKALSSVANSLADLTFSPQEAPVEPAEEGSVRYADDRFGAMALAVALAEPGDAVLIAGAAKSSEGRQAEEATLRQLVELRLTHTKEPAAMR